MAVKNRAKRRTATVRGIHSPSTRKPHKKPSARLVARRKKTTRAPTGFYANPKPGVYGGATEALHSKKHSRDYMGSVIPAQNGRVFAVVYGGVILSLFTTRREADNRLAMLQDRSP